mmetsp:Transcript_24131/g.32896  ORF Transcript_24131/g.32896 Transcript_24131/m.32896 type:complete len:212 (-) Transcript_24131:1501-2136(-)|eukprot:CAMPEP_0176342492 /NCGR_PEP_ID=MMETSP0126-20121128/3205_1 /TAXON_ID=141414 ORGANISM="Strombidinopsis acuminatum, Strain SPMC142" /NCGR_SAMPLE_ID=MMETSP0126 /ASSEMBLY_ACC=CAM_ASM_000229 /LENGTH=211 /DNA_ID=CAMNT_0017687909 /DNA_START=174 /DNA_END=809 /DNA_ORIENTATION=-
MHEDSREIRYLNTNKELTALCSGQLDPNRINEVLMIGSKTALHAYDVENNSDLFDREVSDGVISLAFGNISTIEMPLVVVGGNCSITGFDKDAEEKFWTVTGDNARALEFLDWDEDGEDELAVGSDDFAVRVFKQEELIFDINESSKILSLANIRRNVFGYLLSNGTYGVYYSRKRLWQKKNKEKATAIVGVDFDLDGQMELITGFSNGLV